MDSSPSVKMRISSSEDVHKRFLMDLAAQLTRRNIEELCFLISLPRSRSEEIKNGLHLFDVFLEYKIISSTDVSALSEMFDTIVRRDLAYKVEMYCKSANRSKALPPPQRRAGQAATNPECSKIPLRTPASFGLTSSSPIPFNQSKKNATNQDKSLCFEEENDCNGSFTSLEETIVPVTASESPSPESARQKPQENTSYFEMRPQEHSDIKEATENQLIETLLLSP